MENKEQGGAGAGDGQTERKCGMDMSYVKSINGVLKAKMMGWSLIAFILCIAAGPSITSIFFGVVIFCGLFLSVGLFIVFAFSKDRNITRINIYLFDFLVSVIGTIAYFIVCMASVFNILEPPMIAAAIFGFIAMVSFGASIWFNFKRWREFKPRASGTNETYDTNY
ncbi:CKLF-like MARVEL transmembrane domain-containing protein 7 [Acanthaster planci]|uniref:CKLF-like MARVEL transmembrane domain-containing protein 7 n=1 Tax=Acanthaster planci TaxID=133434 RepID=A0A8B7YMI7_ACAPL|nr:CKLF-like MARVEL transmembrane domain-containing protein 7 [Acanthaster planci]